MCHDEPKLLRNIAKVLKYGKDRLFVHVDNKTNIAPFIEATSDLDNITFIKNRVDVYWGGFSSIVATMNLFCEVLGSDVYFDRIVLLQGKDYPLHSPQYIHNFFSERKTEEFCKGKNITTSVNPSDYMKICGYWIKDGKRTVLRAIVRKIFAVLNTKIKKKYRKVFFIANGERWDIYKGWAQVALTRSCVEYLFNVYKTMPRYNKYMKHRFPPDEIYFHTILYNSPFKDKISTYSLLPREGCEWFSEYLNLTYFEYPVKVTIFSKEEDYNRLLKNERVVF